MARKMKKFSAGGAQGRYDYRMADIKKDFEKDSKGKSGRALEVLEAKRAQRTADAEDDRAKRMGLDRTATRKAEYEAEQRLSRTRKFGADKPAAAAEPAKTTAAAPAAETAKAKPQSFGAAFKEARARLGAGKTFTYNGKSFTTNIAGEGRKPAQRPATTAAATPAKTTAAATPAKTTAAAAPAKASTTATTTPNASSTSAILLAAKAAREKAAKDKAAKEKADKAAKAAANAKRFTSRNVQSAYGAANMAKGGKVKKKETTMKYAKGGSTASQPMPPKKKPKEPITGGANTVPLTPERKEFLKELAKRNAKPGMAKGGKAKSFAATKFGKAMVKKSADTKGRAMVKKAGGGKCYASGGLVAGHKSADGIAKKGKTKTSMTKMKKGGSC
jgi:hypothetical protein